METRANDHSEQRCSQDKEGTHNASDYVFEIHERIAAYRNAIPYLIAVVEAAEEHQRGGAFCMCHLLDGKQCPDCKLRDALSDFRNAK